MLFKILTFEFHFFNFFHYEAKSWKETWWKKFNLTCLVIRHIVAQRKHQKFFIRASDPSPSFAFDNRQWLSAGACIYTSMYASKYITLSDKYDLSQKSPCMLLSLLDSIFSEPPKAVHIEARRTIYYMDYLRTQLILRQTFCSRKSRAIDQPLTRGFTPFFLLLAVQIGRVFILANTSRCVWATITRQVYRLNRARGKQCLYARK